MEKISGIYKIQSKIKPERIYIGSAVNIPTRWYRHLLMLKNGTHRSKKLQRHYDKYGKNDLQFSVLICCDKENLIANEQFFLDSYTTYFNTLKVANSWLGHKHTEESKRKISEIKKGKPTGRKGMKISDEGKQNMKVPHYSVRGKSWTENRKIAQTKVKPRTEEQRKNYSNARIKSWEIRKLKMLNLN
jgi:group I intron endonuclease